MATRKRLDYGGKLDPCERGWIGLSSNEVRVSGEKPPRLSATNTESRGRPSGIGAVRDGNASAIAKSWFARKNQLPV